MYRGFNKNASGYNDPTAAAALAHITHEEKVKRRREKQRNSALYKSENNQNNRSVKSNVRIFDAKL